jgi:DNA-binding response OmpR family regulator
MPGVLLTEESAVVTRALVVQSCPEAARAVGATLADAGIEALTVADGFAAIAAIDAWGPDVVLLDLSLPPLDGWWVLAAAGARTRRPLLVVRAERAEIERAIALGADAWVDDDVHVVAASGRLAPALAA